MENIVGGDWLRVFMTPDVEAIGISCGGPLDSKEGIILSPPNLPGWNQVPIVDMLQSKFGVPAYLPLPMCYARMWIFWRQS